MPSTPAVPGIVPQYRTAVACLVVSLVLHALLVMTGGSAGTASGGRMHAAPSYLRVALVQAESSGVETPTTENLPSKIEATDFRTMRGYPKLLTFSPVELPAARFDERLYQPLSALTVPPTAAEEITISYPHDPYRVGLLVAALTLFIDEDGSVAKVRAEEPHAPANYERAAIEAFSKARFNPGMAGKEPVKSRMSIRVAFESGAGGPSTSAGIRVK